MQTARKANSSSHFMCTRTLKIEIYAALIDSTAQLHFIAQMRSNLAGSTTRTWTRSRQEEGELLPYFHREKLRL